MIRSTTRRLRQETLGSGTPDVGDAKKRAKNQLATIRRQHGEAIIEEALAHLERREYEEHLCQQPQGIHPQDLALAEERWEKIAGDSTYVEDVKNAWAHAAPQARRLAWEIRDEIRELGGSINQSQYAMEPWQVQVPAAEEEGSRLEVLYHRLIRIAGYMHGLRRL